MQAATGTSIRAPANGKDVVEAFYEAYNRRDIAAINQLIADDISYHDLVYTEPHEGRAGVMAWLQKVCSSTAGPATATYLSTCRGRCEDAVGYHMPPHSMVARRQQQLQAVM
jgi:ketosteroid isomerase-like protein